MVKNKKLITVKEFATEYNIGTNKAYEMVNSKGFPVVRLGRKILVIRDKIDEFLYSNVGEKF